MQDEKWNLLTKYLSGELSDDETIQFLEDMKQDSELKSTYLETRKIWDVITVPESVFNEERIKKLVKHKIKMHKKARQNRILYSSLKYAAVFFGLLIVGLGIISDLNHLETVVNTSSEIKKISLPDNSIISLNQNAEITYGNSLFKSFNREITLKGEAYFEIQKSEGAKFTVHTPDYDITVLGTKFNVNTLKNKAVVLTEGKINLSGFQNSNLEFSLIPGDIVEYDAQKSKFVKRQINTNIYTSWLHDKLEFDNFNLEELSKLLELRYNKSLVVKDTALIKTHISGTAPSDDIELIIRALETILDTKIIRNQNQLIINNK